MALKLPRLPRNVPLIDANGAATLQFQRWWQDLAQTIETHEGFQDAIIGLEEATVAAQEAADAANTAATDAATAATDAQTAADGAQAAADATTAQNNLTNSYPSTNPLSATDAGANATITIAGHNRIYGDGTTVAITGGSLTALAYSTEYFVYYDDPTRAGGAVTFVSTTSATTAAQTGDRHLVGSVTTPAAAAPPTTGEAVQPPGVGDLR